MLWLVVVVVQRHAGGSVLDHSLALFPLAVVTTGKAAVNGNGKKRDSNKLNTTTCEVHQLWNITERCCC